MPQDLNKVIAMKLVKITISERSKTLIVDEAVNGGVKIPNFGGIEFSRYIYSFPLVFLHTSKIISTFVCLSIHAPYVL